MINVDYLMAAAREQLPNILTIYESFQEKKPVMLLDIQEERIYVYPYADFSRELSEQSQDSLKNQYEKAIRERQIVVFVRDNAKRRLVSFSLESS